MKLLAFSGESILQFKLLKFARIRINIQEKEKVLINSIRIKFILYFILSTIILLFCWYYLSMFCAIYVNTQIHLLKDTLLSYSLSLSYPFLIYLLPGFFRIPALFHKSKRNSLLFKISKILQII